MGPPESPLRLWWWGCAFRGLEPPVCAVPLVPCWATIPRLVGSAPFRFVVIGDPVRWFTTMSPRGGDDAGVAAWTPVDGAVGGAAVIRNGVSKSAVAEGGCTNFRGSPDGGRAVAAAGGGSSRDAAWSPEARDDRRDRADPTARASWEVSESSVVAALCCSFDEVAAVAAATRCM